MLKGYIPSPVPFIANFGRTNKQRPVCRNSQRYPNYVVLDGDTLRIPTMQILTDASPSGVTTFNLVDIDNAVTIPLSTSDWETHNTPDGLGCLVFPRTNLTVADAEPGRFYHFVVENDTDIFYSQEIYAVPAWPGSEDCAERFTAVKLYWGSPCPIDRGGYHDTTEFELFVAADPIHPAHDITEEGENDSEGAFDPTFQRVEKTLSLDFVAPDYIFDALAHLPLYANKTLEFSDGEVIVLQNTEAKVSWIDSCTGKITLDFNVLPLIKKGCGGDC